MEERTRAYLRGRFRDYYRRATVTPPPAADDREWGYIPWTTGPDTTMVRHQSMLDLGDLGEFLKRERPRHVYFSAGRYETPGANTMGEKGWRDSDLVFDLDADHLPSVTLGEDSYADMLAKCKDALFRLLDFLEDDFGFEDLTVAFSGGRGYHVHIRDEHVRDLESDQRREIVDYVQGNGLAFESIVDEQSVEGIGLQNPTTKRTFRTSGGWSRRAHRRVCDLVDDLLDVPEEDAIDRLQGFEGIGEKKAAAALKAARNNYDEIRAGNIDVHPAFYQLARIAMTDAVDRERASIDEPVTTDTHRLIRLPGSLHGGSGLRVLRIDRDDLDAFDPLTDAVPETFVGHEVTVEATASRTLTLNGKTFTVDEGKVSLPEYAAVFLMARGWAEKGKE